MILRCSVNALQPPMSSVFSSFVTKWPSTYSGTLTATWPVPMARCVFTRWHMRTVFAAPRDLLRGRSTTESATSGAATPIRRDVGFPRVGEVCPTTISRCTPTWRPCLRTPIVATTKLRLASPSSSRASGCPERSCRGQSSTTVSRISPTATT
eukprot:4353640-Pleurochrysis_carterae.AAC.2